MSMRRTASRVAVVLAGGVLGVGVLAGPAAAQTGITGDERAMIALMEPSDAARYLLQKRIQDKAEAAALLSELQNLRHETAMSVIADIR